MSFDNWRKRLEAAKLPTVAERRAAISALKINFSQPTLDDEGYYRKPVTRKKLGADGKSNGQTEIIGWEPVAYFIERHKLCGVIGDRDMAINEVTDEGLWSWVVSNPISEDWYRRVSERGEPWPDMTASVGLDDSARRVAEMRDADRAASIEARIIDDIPAANREVARSDNAPPAEEVLPLDVQHATAIDIAISIAPKVVASDIEADQAFGLANRIRELRLAAEKVAKQKVAPLQLEYETERGKWLPLVQRAKKAEDAITFQVKVYRESERKRIAKEQAEADARQREIDEANARAADRAIAAGLPEEAPEVFEVEMPEPEPLKPVVATYGTRKLKEEDKWFLDEVTDYDALYAYFRNNEVLKTTLKTLATAQVKLGHVVPGTKTHKGLV